MLRRILYPLSGDESSRAAGEVVLDLAREHRALVTSLAAIDTQSPARAAAIAGFGPMFEAYTSLEQLDEKLRASARERLAEFAKLAENSSVGSNGILEEGAPWDCIERESFTHDLLVMGRSAHFRAVATGDEATPGKTLRKVLDTAVCPLLVIGRAPLGRDKVLAGIDGRPCSARALQSYVHSGLRPQAKIFLYWCDESADGQRPDLKSWRTWLEAHGRKVDVIEARGMTRKRLPEFADQCQADLVVLGAHGKSRVAEWILGSTTAEMLSHAKRALWLAH